MTTTRVVPCGDEVGVLGNGCAVDGGGWWRFFGKPQNDRAGGWWSLYLLGWYIRGLSATVETTNAGNAFVPDGYLPELTLWRFFGEPQE
jgi:hypothetical protein